MLHISIAAETLFTILGLPITNSLLTTWIVLLFLLVLSFVFTRKLQKKPGNVQLVGEVLVDGLFSFFNKIAGKKGEAYVPIAVTMFLFILSSNWIGLLPGVGTIGFFEKDSEHATRVIQEVHAAEEALPLEAATGVEALEQETHLEREAGGADALPVAGVEATEKEAKPSFSPLFRAPTADLNTTIALALISFFLMQYAGFKSAGISYAKKFIDLRNPIFFFVGMLEIVSDISKIISFAFRLFGNIFAGEVLLSVMAFLFAFLLPIPFYGLEVFVGVIQSLVFSMLTLVFLSIAVSHGHAEEGASGEAHA